FDGTGNGNSVPAGQTVFLKPGRYTLRAYIRTEAITGDQGITLRVLGAGSPGLNVTTENITGTNTWKLVERQFEVPQGAGLFQVQAFRQQSKSDKIKGTAWID